MLSFLGVAIVLTLMPGPDILFVMAQSISQNAQAGISTALGLCTGLLFHIAAATFGISALIYQSSIAFLIVKYAGAAYLLYLAWQSFRAGKSQFSLSNQHSLNYLSLYKKGILMNLLNPKVSLFFLALLPQFVNEASGYVHVQMLVLGGVLLIQALLIFSAVSLFSDKMRRVLIGNTFIAQRMNVIQAAIFALIGIRIALSE